jgi:hypothetical protein
MNAPMQDSRLKKSAGNQRTDRVMRDRPVTENRQLTDRERAEAYRKQHYNTHLPDLPPIKGFHVCWGTTTNPRETIHGRLRLGYSTIKASELPGFEYAAIKSGEWIGCVGINEMIALKLPLHLYEEYMTISHHEQPLEEERGIVEAAMEKQQQSRGVIGEISLEDGTAGLGKGPAPPTFAEVMGES